ncbi:MAG: transposase [Streptosporangiaceae bacterium]
MSDLVNDALAVLEALTGPGAPERDAAAADALGLLALVAGQDAEPAEDSGGTGGRWRIAGKAEARADYRDAGHDTVIKPGPLRPAVPGGFTIGDFIVDEEQGTVTCPAGQVRPMSGRRAVTSGAACAACPLRELCTTSRDGRSMTIHPHDGLLRAARAQARTPEFKRACPTRSDIERTIAWVATQNGRRVRLRYIGTARNDAWPPYPVRRAEPADPAQGRADAFGRGLGPGLTGQDRPAGVPGRPGQP